MSSILIIIVAILAVAGLAYLIVNKLPSKLKPVVSVVLWGSHYIFRVQYLPKYNETNSL